MPHRCKFSSILSLLDSLYASSDIFFDEIDPLRRKRGGEHEHEASRHIKTKPLVQLDGIQSISGQRVIAPPPPMIHHCHHLVNRYVFFPGLRTFKFCSIVSWKTVDNFCIKILRAEEHCYLGFCSIYVCKVYHSFEMKVYE